MELKNEQANTATMTTKPVITLHLTRQDIKILNRLKEGKTKIQAKSEETALVATSSPLE